MYFLHWLGFTSACLFSLCVNHHKAQIKGQQGYIGLDSIVCHWHTINGDVASSEPGIEWSANCFVTFIRHVDGCCTHAHTHSVASHCQGRHYNMFCIALTVAGNAYSTTPRTRHGGSNWAMGVTDRWQGHKRRDTGFLAKWHDCPVCLRPVGEVLYWFLVAMKLRCFGI